MTNDISEKNLDLRFDTNLPTAIWFNENIELAAVKLYALIRNLTHKYGYCFATNEYLSELMKANISSIKRWLSMLKKEGYIEIETDKKGIHWQRRIYLSDVFKKSLRRLMDAPPPAHPRAPPSSPVSHIIKDSINEDSRKDEERKRSKPHKSEKIERAKNVATTDYQHELLVKEYGVEKVQKMYEKLAAWKDGKGITKKGNDYASIDKWVAEAILENKSIKKENNNEDLIKKIKTKFSNRKDIDFGYNYIEFKLSPVHRDEVKFHENGFRERVITNLRKLDIDIGDL